MKKLSELFKKLWDKFKSFNKLIKIAIIGSILAILIAVIATIAFASSTSYGTLFYGLDSTDSKTVVDYLDKQGVQYKVQGSNILVDKTQVDELRLKLSSSLSSSSKGYELMDNSNSFGMTDEEFAIYKVRMIQGEIEKSIKTINSIEDAKVLITPATDSVFVDSAKEGSASVVLKLKDGVKLSQGNIKAIVSMVSMGTENIPAKNIAVVDTNGNLLTKDTTGGSANSSDTDSSTVDSDTMESESDREKDYEAKIVKKIKDLLEPVVGTGKVQAQVSADLDFDSKKISEYQIDPNDVLISQQTENTYNNANDGSTTSESPVDNNMSNTINNGAATGTSSKSEKQTNNYDHSNTKTETIKAPGEVRRLTVSVFINGKLTKATQTAFENAVKAASGYNANRQDSISLVGMKFDTTDKDNIQKQVDAYNKAQAAAQTKKYIIFGVVGAIILIAGIVTVVIILSKRRREEEEEAILDVVIGDEVASEPLTYEPIDFQTEDKKSHIENEIRKYATEKPEQVADIIKSWLSDNER